MSAPIPPDEALRLLALRRYDILDTPPEEAFDRIARIAAAALGMPILLITFLDERRQWFKARHGIGVTETPRELAFCGHTILSDEVLYVPDATLDERFAANPLVTGEPGIRFYVGAPLKVGDGRRIGTICGVDLRPRELDLASREVLRDLAVLASDQLELRQAGRQAREATQAKSDFLSSMSHEIRTPMTGVLGMADLLATADLPAKEKAQVEAIRTSGRHLFSIINDVLDFSRIEAGRLELERIDFAVPELLERVRSILSGQASEHGLALRFVPTAHADLVLRGDPTRLTQVLINLVSNGIKFTATGGVTLTTRATPVEGGRVRLRFEVQDTGIGIPKGQQAELFQAFVQAEGSTARRFGGSGLGLAICKRLVEAMGGRLGLESEPGLGSLFWVELPLELGDAAALARRTGGEQARPAHLRILVAEDVRINRELMQEMLRRQGHAVVLALNGEEALVLARQESFDVILMDVQMPVLNGVEATARIRRLPPPLGTVPILALTAEVTPKEHARCLEAGMSGILTKPVAWPELYAALAAIRKRDAQPPAAPQPPVAQPPTAQPPAAQPRGSNQSSQA